MQRVFYVVLCLILAGCATRPYWQNNRPGANWNTDLYECTRTHSTTITSGGGTGLVGALNSAEVGSSRTDAPMRDMCLRSRGWYQVAAPTSAPPPASTVVAPPAPPPTPPAASVVLQDAWVFVGGQGFIPVISLLGVFGGNASAHSACENRRASLAQNPTNSSFDFAHCRSIGVSFQEGSNARFGPVWVVAGPREFIGGPSKQLCAQHRGKLLAQNPNITLEPCRRLWFSADPSK